QVAPRPEMAYTVPCSCIAKGVFFNKGDFMRFLIMTLSFVTLVLYGHAIAGLWGYFIGKPGISAILLGLAGGTASGAGAVILWHRYMVKGLFGGKSEESTEEPKDRESDGT
ncbi:MAG: hypothetical protein ACLFN0_00975, partial [Thermovirgaceae bacterium]